MILLHLLPIAAVHLIEPINYDLNGDNDSPDPNDPFANEDMATDPPNEGDQANQAIEADGNESVQPTPDLRPVRQTGKLCRGMYLL